MSITELCKSISQEDRVKLKTREILDILQEECGEVIVAISKCRRFGEEKNREQLVQELGDVSLLIELLGAYYFYTGNELQEAKNKKTQKLNKYSTIYEK